MFYMYKIMCFTRKILCFFLIYATKECVSNVARTFSTFQHLTADLGDFYALTYNFSDPSNPGV